MAETADVIVIGGGCEGTSIAWQLALRKAGKILLLEKRGIGSGATGFSSAIIRTHYGHEALSSMALHGLRVFERFKEIVGGESGFRRTGFLVFLPAADAKAGSGAVAMHRRVGINSVFLGADEFHHIEPRTTRDDIGAVVWEAESGHADPSLTTTSFANAARNAGVETRTGVEVHRLIAPRGRIEALETGDTRYSAGRVVVAANYRTKDLLKTIGIDLPLKPIRHTIAIVERSADFGPFPPIVADRILGAYYRPDGDTRSLIGNVNFERGTVDDDVETAKPGDRREIESLVGRFAQRWRGQDSATLARSYSGVYDCTPDLQPVLGPVGGVEGLFVAAGFSGHGFKLSPAVGEMLSSAVVGERSKIANVGLFDLHRFAREQPIRDQFTYAPAPSGLVPSGTSVKLPPQEGGS